jgi:hypothetical protein
MHGVLSKCRALSGLGPGHDFKRFGRYLDVKMDSTRHLLNFNFNFFYLSI